MKKKILFLIHDLGQGGAEKVLVNLVNYMDRNKFDITLISLFGGGVNEQFLKKKIRYIKVFKKMIPGNSKLMKLFTPEQLHKLFIKEKYDIEISYLEGPTARIISGCQDLSTKKICWIHSNHFSMKEVAASFRSSVEAVKCYEKFDKIICVSQYMRNNFCQWMPVGMNCDVLYNTVESDKIRILAEEPVQEIESNATKLIAVGSLKEVKGFDRLLRIVYHLSGEKYKIHLYLLGIGPLEKEFRDFITQHGLQNYVTLMGYQTNPYKFVAKCDLFVCSSQSEGFSTAATEALVVGTPVCTTEVSGMKEMLGNNNEYGIVTENSEEALYEGIKKLLDDPELLQHYKGQAVIRGKMFSTESTVKAVEEMLLGL